MALAETGAGSQGCQHGCDGDRRSPGLCGEDYPHRTFGWSSLRSLRTGKYLSSKRRTRELYDQSADPKEEHNLSGTRSQ